MSASSRWLSVTEIIEFLNIKLIVLLEAVCTYLSLLHHADSSIIIDYLAHFMALLLADVLHDLSMSWWQHWVDLMLT